MRVLHLASQHRADDVRIFLKECRSLAAAGYEVHFVAPEAANENRDGVTLHGFALPGGYRPVQIVRRLWRVWRVAQRVDADLVHFHEPVLLPVALLLRRRGAPVVYDVHEDHLGALEDGPFVSEGWKRLGLRLFEAFARRTCDGFVAATPAIARQLPRDRTVEVLNYALLEEFSETPHAAANGRNVVYIGVLTRGRALREMLAAVDRLSDPDARLVLGGRFSPPELEQETQALPGWSRVDYLGPLDRREVSQQLAAARAGLVLFHPQPNHIEALPNKLFEYMAAGLPVIASDFAYWRSLLDPIGCALWVDPLDPGQIAAAIDELLTDEEGAKEMGRRGAAAVRDSMNWERQAPKLIELYERLGVSA